MTRKILLLVLLAAFAAVATEALSQVPGAGSSAPAAGKTTESPPATSKNPAITFPSATSPAVISSPLPKSDAAKSDTSKSDNAKSDNAKSDNAKSDNAKSDNAKAKDATPSKTFSTSSVSPPGSTPGRRELVIERGLVTLIDDNKVPATEAGMLTDVPAKEGQSVDKDTLVAQIDSRSTMAKREIAVAELAAASATAANDAEVEVARAGIKVAKAEFEQSKEIRASNQQAVSLSQLRKDEFNYEKSLAQEKQAVNEKKIAGLTANAKQAQLDAASIELDLRQIRSPFRGEVVEVMKHVGDWVTVGEPIMHIVGLDRVRVKGYVLVGGASGASHDEVIGKPVTISVDSAGGKKYTKTGIIGFASPVIEGFGSDRQFRIWADVDNEKSIDSVTQQVSWKIQPGSMATMTIDLAPPKPAVPAKTEPAKGDKGKTQAFKPVTGEADKTGKVKSKER